MATNITRVYLLNVPLEDDMKNTLYFANETAQRNYFNSKIGKTYLNVSYQSDTRTFRCPDQYDTIRQYNYIMWQNTAYTNKWFYAFIKDTEFVSPGYTDVIFEVDPIQTFMFDITVKPSFIEREHTNNDTPGNNLVPEGLEHGEYVMNGDPTRFTPYAPSPVYIINADREPSTDGSGNPTGAGTAILSTNVGGVPMSGGLYFFYDMPTLTNAFLTYSRMTGGLDHIKNVYVTTESCFDGSDLIDGTYELEDYVYYKYRGTSSPEVTDKTISAPTTLNGYSPRNAKLLSAPYQFILLSNGCGSSNQLNYEYFSNRSSIQIRCKGVPVVGGSVFAYPLNYKSATDNINEGVMGGKYPTLSWSGDAYTNWLTQNSVNIGANMATSALGIGAGAITGVLTGGVGSAIALGTIVSSVQAVTNQMVEIYDHSIVPNTFSGNINGGDVMTSSKQNELLIWKVSITADYASRLDSYFDMFGYKTCKVKTPNVAHRQNWWYTKTVNANIIGNVPNDYMNKIKEAYDNGLTFWRNPENFLDYSVSNGIV